jgi:hypothetical protein
MQSHPSGTVSSIPKRSPLAAFVDDPLGSLLPDTCDAGKTEAGGKLTVSPVRHRGVLLVWIKHRRGGWLLIATALIEAGGNCA